MHTLLCKVQPKFVHVTNKSNGKCLHSRGTCMRISKEKSCARSTWIIMWTGLLSNLHLSVFSLAVPTDSAHFTKTKNKTKYTQSLSVVQIWCCFQRTMSRRPTAASPNACTTSLINISNSDMWPHLLISKFVDWGHNDTKFPMFAEKSDVIKKIAWGV